MCFNCGDLVEMCGQEGCRGPELLSSGRRNLFGLYRKFYLGDTLCEHLTAVYGTSDASEYDRRRREEEEAADAL